MKFFGFPISIWTLGVSLVSLSSVTAALLMRRSHKKFSFPQGPEQIPPAFFTKILRDQDIIPHDISVQSYKTESLKGGVHFKVVRAVLTYNSDQVDIRTVPSSVVIKMINAESEVNIYKKLLLMVKRMFPKLSLGEQINELHNRIQGYNTELMFYTSFEDRVRIPTPDCHFCYEDYYNIKYLMVLEDLSAYCNGEPNGFDILNANILIKNIAKMHSEFWGSDRFYSDGVWPHGGYWMGNKEMQFDKPFEECFGKLVKNFDSFLADLDFLPELEELICSNEEKIHNLVHSLTPKTMIHGDYKISNVFIKEKTKKAFTIDWQWMGGGAGATDLAYLIYTTIRIDENNLENDYETLFSSREDELIEFYHNELSNKGVKDYPLSLLKEQYMLNAIYFFIFCVREKWSYMTIDDINQYKSTNTDGLHVRSTDHILRLLKSSYKFIKHLNQHWQNA